MNKKDLLHARISRRMRSLGIEEFDVYLSRLSNSDAIIENESFLSILTTNTTSFFRERHHFKFLKEQIVPEIIDTGGSPSIRIWSAGCSFGHEPFSIAATLNSADTRRIIPDVKVIASDVDDVALRRCYKAKYNVNELNGLSSAEVQALGDVDLDEIVMSNNNRLIVEFKNINLIHDFDHSEKFDVIFCRNVMIYFSKETQQKVWNRFLKFLAPGGYLILGHSERLTGSVARRFESVGLTAYRRID